MMQNRIYFMDNQWKCEVCGTCDFNVSGKCYKLPPTLKKPSKISVEELGFYEIKATYGYPSVNSQNKACSYWRENNSNIKAQEMQ
jgi:hypothetical protein